MGIAEQKLIAEQILAKLVAIDPRVVLAGGAVRDWILGREATDLDFYIHTPTWRSYADVTRQINAVGLKISKTMTDEMISENYATNPWLRIVFNIEGYDIPVQIMGMSEAVETTVVPKFAISLSKAWWTGGDKLHSTWEFDKSVKHKIFWMQGEVYGDNGKYIKKIMGKFPDYKFLPSQEEVLRQIL